MAKDNVLPDGTVVDAVLLIAMQDEAKRWVRTMLERAEIPVSGRCREAVHRAIKELVKVYVKYGDKQLRLSAQGDRERDRILRELIQELEGLIYMYAEEAADDEDEKAWILAFLGKEYKDDTLHNRMEANVAKLGVSVKQVMALDLHDEEFELESDAEAWGNKLVWGAIAGVEILTRLARTEVARGWMEEWRRKHEDARYVHVWRGSSYPCEWCDSIVAKGWQKVDGSEEVPPIHPNCRCWCVYI